MQKRNVLVTGCKGQLGSELQALSVCSGDLELFFYDLPELDITRSDHIERFCRTLGVHAIVNCAAYTAVDRAETDIDAAFLVNRQGAAVLASCAKEHGIMLLHISTDYVFNGESCVPYRETDPASPLGVYGLSKWEGEECIRQIAPSHIIIRTSWLYSVYGSNFVKTMLRLGSERESLHVVFDQVGTPTCAADLAGAIKAILERYDSSSVYRETYHYSNEGVCSWYDFALAVIQARGLPCRVLPVETSEYPTTARRPHFSVLNKGKIKKEWELVIPHWKASLERTIGRMTEGSGRQGNG
jgi:dTDP-4-dehydrorhamnose reductase